MGIMGVRLYEGSIEKFREDVMENRIADAIARRYEELYGGSVSPSEKNSWVNSLNFMKNALDYSNLRDNMVAVEYGLPYCSKRIDFLLFGNNTNNEENVIVMELKQWSNENVKDTEEDGNLIVHYGRGWIKRPHPSSQVEGYYYNLKDYKTLFEKEEKVFLSCCSYCHNYSKEHNNLLSLPKFKKYTDKFPVFYKEDAKALGEYLKERLNGGSGLEVFNRFINSPIKPSKKLLEHATEMINKQQIFCLIDDQIAAYNVIMHKAKHLSKSNRKAVIIVKGGPGTGKSVIALEVMGELLRAGRMVYHATGSSAFTNTLRKILGKRLELHFKFFYAFSKHKENEVDVLICDEAHRIRRDSNDFRVPFKYKSKNPQVEDLIRPAKMSIFFIDEHQIVRPNEIGSVELIRAAAEKLGAEMAEFELKTQFRCSGSDAFLQWVENLLGITKSDKNFLTSEDRLEFRIFNSPKELKDAIGLKNQEKKNCARIVSGFCWPWSEPNKDGTLVDDVVIGDFKMPWEQKNEFWKWATDDSGMEQVGTVYTAQGFEFDYIGVIFGTDLAYDKVKGQWVGKPENSYDNMVKRNNEKFTEHLKNVYRVLMSRAHRGCYVYFMDKDTEEFFRSRIKI